MKSLFVLALASTALVAAPAYAQSNVSSGNSLSYTLNADVGTICGVYNTGGQAVTINLGDLAELTSVQDATATSEAVYRCNSTGGFSREIKSANGGALVRQASDTLAANRISYRFSHGGGTDLEVARGRPTPLGSTAITTTHAGSLAYLTGVKAPIGFEVSGVFRTFGGFADGAPGTSVFAGDYSDTVTISVIAR